MHPIDRHVGHKIRERRLELGFNQDDLAKFLELSPQQIQKYETGANRVSASRLYGISTILNVPTTYFFDELSRSSHSASPTPDGEEEQSATIRDELQRIQRALRRIKNPKLRRKILHLVEAMANEVNNDD